MSKEAMSLKAKIRNLARRKDMSAQVVLQNYMFERFLERLSKSSFRDKFILKGGLLISVLVGIDNRATMDLDATIKNYSFDIDSVSNAIKNICNISIDDHVTFTFSSIDAIRDGDDYGGYRVNIVSAYDTILTPMQLDITTSDVITPKEVLFQYKMIFEEKSIGVWAYNIETILAEKVETILRRGELNTRPRDFYDVYILSKTQSIDFTIFIEALKSTALHRETSFILIDFRKRIDQIETSETLKSRWHKYTKDYHYAEHIEYSDVIDALRLLLK